MCTVLLPPDDNPIAVKKYIIIKNISFDASLFTYINSTNIYIYIYIYSTNIPPIVIINRIYENQNLLSL